MEITEISHQESASYTCFIKQSILPLYIINTLVLQLNWIKYDPRDEIIDGR